MMFSIQINAQTQHWTTEQVNSRLVLLNNVYNRPRVHTGLVAIIVEFVKSTFYRLQFFIVFRDTHNACRIMYALQDQIDRDEALLLSYNNLVPVFANIRENRYVIQRKIYRHPCVNVQNVSNPIVINTPRHIVQPRVTISNPVTFANSSPVIHHPVSNLKPAHVEINNSKPVRVNSTVKVQTTVPVTPSPLSIVNPVRMSTTVQFPVSKPVKVNTTVPIQHPVSILKPVKAQVQMNSPHTQLSNRVHAVATPTRHQPMQQAKQVQFTPSKTFTAPSRAAFGASQAQASTFRGRR